MLRSKITGKTGKQRDKLDKMTYYTIGGGQVREVSFFTRRGGAPENWGDQVLSLRSKGGSTDFFKLKSK